MKGHNGNILRADTNPTPRPAKKRPATNRGRWVAAVCKMTPKINTPQETIRDHLLPSLSAIGAAPRAPKNVPAERIETTSDCWEEVMFKCPVVSLYPVENWFCQKLQRC